MGAVARLVKTELGPAGNNLLAERHESRQHVAQVHHLRTPAIERDHVGAERGLQRRELVELIEDDLGERFLLDLDHDTIAVAVGFIAQRRDAIDPLLAPKLADALDHRGLVHLIRNLGDDDRFAVTAQRFDRNLAAHDDRAAAGLVGGVDP